MVSGQYIRQGQGQVAQMRGIAAVLGNEAMGANTEGLEVSFEGCAKRHVEFVRVGAVVIERSCN